MEPANAILQPHQSMINTQPDCIRNSKTAQLLLSMYQPLFESLPGGRRWLKALKYDPAMLKMHRKGEELLPQIQALEERTLQGSVLRSRMQFPSLLLKFLIFWLLLARSWEALCGNSLWKYFYTRQTDPTFTLLFLPSLIADYLSWQEQKAH